jgi:hypothetical protein
MFAVYRARAGAFRRAFEDRTHVHDALDEIRHAIVEHDAKRAEQLTLDYLRDSARRFLGAPNKTDDKGKER